MMLGTAFVVALAGGLACRPDTDGPPKGTQEDQVERKREDLLVFPEALRVADAAVNRFVERAMRVCGDGDYDKFRLLWTAREEPLPRNEYDQGWQAVRKIRIRALQVFRLDEGARDSTGQGDIVYILAAGVSLDPDHPAGRREPERSVILNVVREHDQWRLARAPRPMRIWMEEHLRAGDAAVISPASEVARGEAPE